MENKQSADILRKSETIAKAIKAKKKSEQHNKEVSEFRSKWLTPEVKT